MFERFSNNTKAKVQRATDIAEAEGAALVEVDHLLLALVDPSDDPIGEVLIEAGLTTEAIKDARDREFRAALSIAGVETTRPAPSGPPRLRRGRSTRFAQSSKLTLQRTLKQTLEAGDRRISNEHLLRAILEAKVGKIPRLLAELGTTPDEILGTLHRA